MAGKETMKQKESDTMTVSDRKKNTMNQSTHTQVVCCIRSGRFDYTLRCFIHFFGQEELC